MTKRVFISRDLKPDSPFYARLSAAGFEVYGFSLLAFKAIEFLSPPPVDWVFCYSARSADFFLQGLEKWGIAAGQYAKFAALGPGTAASLLAGGITAAFIGSGRPEESAVEFLQVARGQRVLFPRAGQSQQSIQRLLKGQLEAFDLIVYDNSIRPALSIPLTDYVVLTSPLNVQAYLGVHNPGPRQRLVVIGNTTATALKAQGNYDFRIAEAANEAALAQSILDWEK